MNVESWRDLLNGVIIGATAVLVLVEYLRPRLTAERVIAAMAATDRRWYVLDLVAALGRPAGHAAVLYPVLYQLEAAGVVAAEWDEDGPRPRRVYWLTGRERAR